jgi:hypothetical protein
MVPSAQAGAPPAKATASASAADPNNVLIPSSQEFLSPEL